MDPDKIPPSPPSDYLESPPVVTVVAESVQLKDQSGEMHIPADNTGIGGGEPMKVDGEVTYTSLSPTESSVESND